MVEVPTCKRQIQMGVWCGTEGSAAITERLHAAFNETKSLELNLGLRSQVPGRQVFKDRLTCMNDIYLTSP